MSRHVTQGFTLIELLVVITIIVVLLALLAPALDRAIHQAVKTQCAGRHHGLLSFFNMYAADNKRRYPLGKRQQGNEQSVGSEEDIHWVHKRYFVDQAVRYGAAQTTHGVPDSTGENWGMVKPPENLFDPTIDAKRGFYGGLGFVIGFEYLGGHPFLTLANKDWESPISLADQGSGKILACENRSVIGNMAWIAHLESGDSLYSMAGGDTPTADEPYLMGSEGGNIGRTDGSAGWTDIDEMKKYDGYGHAGSTPDDGFQWPGYW